MKRLSLLFTNPSRFTILAILIVLFAFTTRIVRSNFPTSFFFDEVYHGFTATTYLHNDAKGYEYWQSPPEGVAYEWTHPPLAKLFMAAGMLLVGENSVGWRLSSIVFGTGTIILTGLLAHRLFKNEKLTLMAMLLLALDGLYLSMSRIAMNDMHFVFFMLVSVLLYIDIRKAIFDPHTLVRSTLRFVVLCAIAFGLAVSSKWTAMYAGLGMGIDLCCALLYRWNFPVKKLLPSAIVGALLIASVYLLSYGQFFLQGHTFTQFKETTQQMWWYHTGLVATHSYQSRPWQWVLDLKPVWMHVDYTQAESGKTANIYNIANPIFLWLGLICVSVIAILTAQKFLRNSTIFVVGSKQKLSPLPWERSFLLLMYVILWMPWIASPRIMFFYHYAPALPFLAILTAYSFTWMIKTHPNGSKIVGGFFVLIAFAFLALYPLNTGLFMPTSYFDTVFRFFPMWK